MGRPALCVPSSLVEGTRAAVGVVAVFVRICTGRKRSPAHRLLVGSLGPATMERCYTDNGMCGSPDAEREREKFSRARIHAYKEEEGDMMALPLASKS